MLRSVFRDNMRRITEDSRGAVLPVVMSFIALMVMSTITLSTLVQRDVGLVERVKLGEQARFAAEAGLNHALADVRQNGFASRSDFNDVLDNGSYSVTYSSSGGRYLVISTGTVSGVNVSVSAEIEDNTPTALNYFSGAGNDVRMKIHTNVNGSIKGDIHGNNDVYMFVQPHARLDVTGDLSACNIVQEGNQHYNSDNKDKDLYVNGQANDAAVVYEDADRITFPEFDFAKYKEAAIDSGDYYGSSQVFNSVSFAPANGVVYVDGDATITGTCTFQGGLIADNIYVEGTLQQVKSGDRNVIASKAEDVVVSGRLEVQEAVVYASQDIRTHENWGAQVFVNGTMLARRDISMWNFRTEIDYVHIYILPIDLTEESSGFSVVSWND